MADSSKCRKSRVTVESMLTVVSSRPVTPPGQTHELSALDRLLGAHTVHLIYYCRVDPVGSFDTGPLRVSLSEVLSMYPPVTGRLARDGNGNWAVKCNDAGVRTLLAKVGTTLDQWLRSADASEERDLTMWDDMPQDPHIWSPFRIQINQFEGGGVAIGLSCTHMNADPTSLSLFFKSWSQFYRHRSIPQPPSFLSPHTPHSTQLPPSPLPSYPSPVPPHFSSFSSATFKFSHQNLLHCLSTLHASFFPEATPFDLLTALFWTRIANADSKHHRLSICVDSRRSSPKNKLPLGLFGNAVQFSPLLMWGGDLMSLKIEQVAKEVHDHVSKIKELEIEEEFSKSQPPRMYGPELTIVSMEHLAGVSSSSGAGVPWSEMYEAMFVDGERPVHVSCNLGNVEGEGLIVVLPEEGLGRTVMVLLPEEETVTRLRQDEELLKLEPTVMLCASYS